MSKVTYASLKLKIDNSINTFDFNGNSIEVLKYLPIEDKYDLIMIALKNSEEEKNYNPLKLDMYFHLYLIYFYSNLTFTDKQREDEPKLYDCLKSNGFLDSFLAAMDEDEYNDLVNFLNETLEEKRKYKMSTTALFAKVIDDMPSAAEAAAKLVENFNPEQYQKVVSLAKSAGMR